MNSWCLTFYLYNHNRGSADCQIKANTARQLLTQHTSFIPDQICTLLALCLTATYFKYEDFYRQKHECAMGSPVWPTISNLWYLGQNLCCSHQLSGNKKFILKDTKDNRFLFLACAVGFEEDGRLNTSTRQNSLKKKKKLREIVIYCAMQQGVHRPQHWRNNSSQIAKHRRATLTGQGSALHLDSKDKGHSLEDTTVHVL